MDLLGKKVLVAGCGKSGLGAAGLLQKAGAVPVLFDENEKLDGKALCAREDYPKDTALVLGSLPKELLSELSLAVLSPGISIEEAFVSTLEEADIPVWGEIELAWNYEKGKVLAITGTNGKTTTTTLVGEILKRYQDNTFVVGNIGTPYTQEVLKTDKDSVTVAEISSFQLETAVHFHQRDFKYHAGSFEPSSYDGELCGGQGIHHEEPDKGRFLCAQSRGQLVKGVCTEVPGPGHLVFFQRKAGERLLSGRQQNLQKSRKWGRSPDGC